MFGIWGVIIAYFCIGTMVAALMYCKGDSLADLVTIMIGWPMLIVGCVLAFIGYIYVCLVMWWKGEK